ncbi:hypothetical protein [Kitasatospora sp. NPDC085879]|uniref:hypothetical protein n=1 Tax=Kitasatospora sp. NPDC085879 TaxID=3154769 RepID=UPI00342DEFB9
MTAEVVEHSWDRIDAWLREHAPHAADRGGSAPVDPDGPLGLRLRALIRQAEAHWDADRQRVAQHVVNVLGGRPHRAVEQLAAERSRLSAGWRDELHADLGHPSLPPVPDDLFWAELRNPDTDSAWYASYYGRTAD